MSNARWLLAFLLLLAAGPSVARAQATFGDQPTDDQPDRTPEDENQKIRERAGADDENKLFSTRRPTTPEELYTEAERLLKRGYYTKAQEYLERVRIRFPFSQYAVLADLKIGEVYMKKGEYALAVEAYRDFRKLHPNHPETHYVVYMMAMAEFKQAPKWAPRDQAATERALEILDGARPPATRPGMTFEERFPDSPHIAEVQQLRLDGRERLAKKIFHIGRFYQKRSRYGREEDKVAALKAAAARFADVEEQYPGTAIIPQARLQQIRCQVELGQLDAAAQSLSALEKESPDSRELRQARQVVDRAREGAARADVAGR